MKCKVCGNDLNTACQCPNLFDGKHPPYIYQSDWRMTTISDDKIEKRLERIEELLKSMEYYLKRMAP